MDIPDFANSNPATTKLGSLSSYLRAELPPSPLDHYLQSVRALLKYGDAKTLKNVDFLGRLLVLGIVSAAEGYIRSALAVCLELCPVARASASKQNIGLGGLLWHGKAGYSRSAFELQSFASKDELAKAFKNYTGIILDDSAFKVVLDEFDSVCHLRHGIVHGDGFLPGRNAVHLDIPSYSTPVRIVIDYAELQNVAAVVNNLVFTLNRVLFSGLCKRWAVDWRQRADWVADDEEKRLRQIWQQFHSIEDKATRAGRSKITFQLCMLAVRNEYGL